MKRSYGKAANWATYGLDQLRTECQALAAAVAELCNRTVDVALRQIARRLAEATLGAAEDRRADGRLEFHDLLVLARNLLRQPDHGAQVRATLQRRYRRLLLDEFQDTDPIQIELAVRIAAGKEADAENWTHVDVPDGSLFVVGDPKQSIYRFRRADIATYLDAQQRIGEDVVLSTNFRTGRPVLDWINHTFGQLIEAEPGSQPAYRPLNASRPTCRARKPPLKCCPAGSHPGTARSGQASGS